MALITLK